MNGPELTIASYLKGLEKALQDVRTEIRGLTSQVAHADKVSGITSEKITSVASELDRLRGDLRAMGAHLDRMRTTELQQLVRDIAVLDVSTVKVKAGIWGFGAGSIPAIISVLINYFA